MPFSDRSTVACDAAVRPLGETKPWQTVPSDQSLISVTIEKLRLKDAALLVIGQMGESMGLVLFASVDDFEVYVDSADAMQRGEKPAMPPHLALHFDRGAELDAALRKEIAEHHWEVEGADAYPWLVAVDGDLVTRPPTAQEVTMTEAIAIALPKVLSDKQPLLAAWNGGKPVAQTVTVHTHTGDLAVTLRVPYDEAPSDYRPPYDVLAGLFELAQDGEELDAEACAPLEDELVRRFVASAEAKTLSDVQACIQIFAEGRLTPIGGAPVQVLIGGQELGATLRAQFCGGRRIPRCRHVRLQAFKPDAHKVISRGEAVPMMGALARPSKNRTCDLGFSKFRPCA